VSTETVENGWIHTADALLGRIASILEAARGQVVRTVNHATVSAYWHIETEFPTRRVANLSTAALHREFPTHWVGNRCPHSTPI